MFLRSEIHRDDKAMWDVYLIYYHMETVDGQMCSFAHFSRSSVSA